MGIGFFVDMVRDELDGYHDYVVGGGVDGGGALGAGAKYYMDGFVGSAVLGSLAGICVVGDDYFVVWGV